MSHLPERGLDLVALVLAHQAVVHEDAGELVADGLGQQRRRDGASPRRRDSASSTLPVPTFSRMRLDGGLAR